jgi:hypothetical protein
MILVGVAGGTAQAHRPRLAGARLALYMADGPVAELRLLYGDGILAHDPVRPVVVGAHGEVYALGPKGEAAVIACNGWQCRVFIFLAHGVLPLVLVPDKSAFVFEPVHRADDDDATAATEQAEETYGFLALPLGPVLLAQGAWAFIAASPLQATLLVAIALALWPTCRLARAAFRAPPRRRRAGLAAAAAVCALATLALWVFAWGLLSFVTGFPAPIAALLTGVTAVVVLASLAFAGLRRRRAAAA